MNRSLRFYLLDHGAEPPDPSWLLPGSAIDPVLYVRRGDVATLLATILVNHMPRPWGSRASWHEWLASTTFDARPLNALVWFDKPEGFPVDHRLQITPHQILSDTRALLDSGRLVAIVSRSPNDPNPSTHPLLAWAEKNGRRVLTLLDDPIVRNRNGWHFRFLPSCGSMFATRPYPAMFTFERPTLNPISRYSTGLPELLDISNPVTLGARTITATASTALKPHEVRIHASEPFADIAWESVVTSLRNLEPYTPLVSIVTRSPLLVSLFEPAFHPDILYIDLRPASGTEGVNLESGESVLKRACELFSHIPVIAVMYANDCLNNRCLVRDRWDERRCPTLAVPPSRNRCSGDYYSFLDYLMKELDRWREPGAVPVLRDPDLASRNYEPDSGGFQLEEWGKRYRPSLAIDTTRLVAKTGTLFSPLGCQSRLRFMDHSDLDDTQIADRWSRTWKRLNHRKESRQ